MKKLLQTYRILWVLGLLFLIIAFSLELYFLNHNTDVSNFKTTLREEENRADAVLHSFQSENDVESIIKKTPEFDQDAISYFVYDDKDLTFWSNNLIDVPEVFESSFFNQALLHLKTGYYAVRKRAHLNKNYIALIHIYHEYDTNNIYLKNTFTAKLKPVFQSKLSLNAQQGNFISNKQGKYLFSLIQSNQLTPDTRICIWISFLYLFGILLLTAYFIILLRRLKTRKQLLTISSVILALLVIRSIMLYFGLPRSLYSLHLFSPDLHASSTIFRSLGDYWINALIIALFAYFIPNFNINRTPLTATKIRINISLAIFLSLAILLGLFAFEQIKSLVLNSSFSLQVYVGSGIEFYAIWGYAGATLFLFSIIVFLRNILMKYQRLIGLFHFYKTWFTLLSLFAILFLFINKSILPHLLFLAILGGIQGSVRYVKSKKVFYFPQVFTLIVSTIYLTSLISIYSEQKEQKVRLAKAQSIMESNSPETKALLETISAEWNNDDVLLNLFQDPIANEQSIKEHLRNHYFGKSWFNYNLQVFICTDQDKVENFNNTPEDLQNCFNEFNQILNTASRIENTPFYELNTYQGLTSYIGVLSFITGAYGEIRLFIRLDLKPYESEIGYLDLLVNSHQKTESNKRYSFAKYINNKLRYATGVFDYYSLFEVFENQINEQSKAQSYFVQMDGYNHYIYNVTDNYKIIVSDKELSLYKQYIAFPYVFFLLFFIYLPFWLLETYPWENTHYHSFSQQIKITLIATITLAFFIVGGVSLYYSFSSNQNKYLEEHNNKIKMLRQELFTNLESAKDLDPYFNPLLKESLQNYSRILGADINIYDIYGVLLATSQPEIFDKGLVSNRMNYHVLNKLNRHEITEVTEQEHIGNLEYSSVYVILWNNKNEPIAYLNVPFFMKYKQFKAEMQDVIIGVLNINLLLIILALIVAFIISQRITSPLVNLREKFSKISLGRENEKISYKQNDEIKGLVDAYNAMVDELEESAKLLSKSERESAWREMARQVAHEIKNPLTPMKLNLQFLQRKLDGNPEDWKAQFEQSSRMLLNQIDELASIASAFSDFAKMPTLQNEEFDLIELLHEITMLYDKGEVPITLTCKLKKATIFADKNQIRRVFINLIRNAIQAMSDFSVGKIDLKVKARNNKEIEVFVIDNGKGISEELKTRIFTPNFTTKNSGMGLGLALSKDSITQAKGSISFESEEGKGTTFRVVLPIFSA